MVKVGLRAANMPTSEEQAVLAEFIMNHYGAYTTDQINEAFDLAITGQLPIKDSGCYENFSCEYFGRIMNGYKSFLIQSGRVMKNTDRERMHVPESNLPALPMPEADWTPHIEDLAAKIASGEVPAIIPTAIYDFLLKKSLLTNPYNDFLIEADHLVIAKLTIEKQDGGIEGKNINQVLADIEAVKAGNQTEKVIIQAKRLAIIHYLNEKQ